LGDYTVPFGGCRLWNSVHLVGARSIIDVSDGRASVVALFPRMKASSAASCKASKTTAWVFKN
jgi:hypothetical protein